ncbi:MAG: hypothetical protein Hyperionvirus13_19 [Hyperionvirus sp.]|uniref:Uncharacterized protein n=1 Tax=Hyperionvirus sp. TaxID=2487770 RepID=A0A3G5A9B9_9VIRU|nr:MAG: hypothetical protein Hyperionvirus13_19 [Hyperionvirus sp.]
MTKACGCNKSRNTNNNYYRSSELMNRSSHSNFSNRNFINDERLFPFLPGTGLFPVTCEECIALCEEDFPDKFRRDVCVVGCVRAHFCE